MEIENTLEVYIKEIENLNKDDANTSKICQKIREGIKNGNFTILQLVEQLEELLTHFAPVKRELGVEVLTQVLEKLNERQLTTEQLRFIANFYADRLKDHHQVLPAVIRGILALIRYNNFPDGCGALLLNSIFLNVPCQQQQCCERQNIYRIFEVLFERKTQELQNMGLDFVYGVISAMDSERDPRMLLILFRWLPKFLKNVNLSHLNEEMFETIACYFPVDFRAPTAEEKNGITRDVLADGLCLCLCAIPSFAQFCLPLALEKLDSSLKIAKLDSLKLLKEGCKTFEIEIYQENSIQIWSLIYKELLQNNDLELELICLETLREYIAKLSNGDEKPFTLHLKDIIDTIKGNLLPDAKLFETTTKILLNITQASEKAARFTAKEILPILINTYNITKTPTHQIKLLKVLVCFYKILNGFSDEHLQQIPFLIIAALNHSDLQMKITAWNSISVIDLPQNLKHNVFEHIKTNLTQNLHSDLKEAFHNCFKSLAIKYPEEIEWEIVNKIEVLDDKVALKSCIEALSEISTQKQFIAIIFPIIMRYCLGNALEAEIGFQCLCDVLEKHEINTEITKFLNGDCDAIKNIIKWCLNCNFELKIDLLQNISIVLKILMGSLNQQQQESLLATEIKLLNQENVVLLNGLLLRLHEKVVVDKEIVEMAFQMALKNQPDPINQMCVELFANLLNKMSNEEILDCYLQKIQHKCNEKLIAWITKALVMRNHRQATFWIENVLDLLEVDATLLRIIMSERSDALSIKSHCKIQLFYRQKFFLFISNKLNDLHPNISDNFLVAFGFLLQETPQQILLTAIEKILKPMMLCIDKCTTPEALCSICQTLLQLIENKHELIEDYISDLLPRLLKLSMFKPSMKVRIAALKCLTAITKDYPVYKLLPHKQNVIIELAVCLDDPKRLVRKEAVEARSRWFLIDAPV